ncbi:universal stress protein [Phormidium tenue FACHB-886]|nr:universal stress protein [Phormidium tenue FACHB-886]
MFQKILVALDRSPLSEHVLGRSIALAQSLTADLMLLHVLSADEEGSPQLPLTSTSLRAPAIGEGIAFETYQKLWENFEQQGLEFLQTHLQTVTQAGIKAEFTQTPGRPGVVICGLAKTWGADLIVVGRRGRSGLSEFFLGSISNYVLHHAPCEVLTVPPQSAQHS